MYFFQIKFNTLPDLFWEEDDTALIFRRDSRSFT